jgi:flagellar hook-length control protein FliK
MLTTSSMPLPLLPATAGSATGTVDASAESTGASGFHPILAALTRQPGGVDAATTVPDPDAGAMPPEGNSLPPGGAVLPPVLTDEDEATLDEATLPVEPETPDAAVLLPPAPPPVTADAQRPPADGDTETPEPLTGPAAALDADPAASSVQAATTAAAAPAPAVTGAVKRLLPAAERAVATDTATAKAAEAARTPLVSPGAGGAPQGPAFDLDAAIEQLETADIDGANPAPAVGGARENAARHYQGLVPAQAQVDVPVGRPGWSSAVVDKLMWFSAQQISSAEIHLNPAELGPLSVRISTHQEQTSVYFTSHHASVRDALDQALPRLREMFDSQGMQLLDAGVGEHGQARQQTARGGEGGAAHGGADVGDDGHDDELAGTAVTVRVASGLVDAYA